MGAVGYIFPEQIRGLLRRHCPIWARTTNGAERRSWPRVISPNPPPDGVRALAFSPDGQWRPSSPSRRGRHSAPVPG